jgi:flagellar hook-associated protein 2
MPDGPAVLPDTPVEAPARFSEKREAESASYAVPPESVWRLNTLLSAAAALVRPETFSVLRGWSSEPHTATISVGAGAPAGDDVLVVRQLAQRRQIITGPFESHDSPLGQAGELIVNGRAVSIAPSDSLADICAKTIAADAGASAAVVAAGWNDYRLTLTSAASGLAAAVAIGGEFATAFIGDVVPARDAVFTIEGVRFTRPANVVDDLLPGVVLTLHAGSPENPATAVLTVEHDADVALRAVSRFVAAFNDVQNFVTEESFLSASTDSLPASDEGAPRIPDSLASMVSAWPAEPMLAEIGFARDDWGLITVDYDRLRAAFRDSPAQVAALFGAEEWRATSEGGKEEEYEGLRLVNFTHTRADGQSSIHGALDQLIDVLGEVLAPMLRPSVA